MPTHLSVNVNAIAQLRNRRNLPWPSVTGLARIALEAGAAGITVHPRPDERHIRRHDVFDLVALLRADFPKAEFNMEGYPDERFLALCEEAKPDQVTLVPDDPAQATSDHGWDVITHAALLKGVVARLKGRGFRVSLFLDADPALVAGAKATGTDRIELYTGPYGHAADAGVQAAELKKLVATTEAASAVWLGVNAGHDLTLANLPQLIAGTGHRRGVDRPCAHRRCADLWHGRDSPALPKGLRRLTRDAPARRPPPRLRLATLGIYVGYPGLAMEV